VRRRTARALAALADGSLPPARRAAVLRRVLASPKLGRALDQQLAAIVAVRAVAKPAPAPLRRSIERTMHRRSRYRAVN